MCSERAASARPTIRVVAGALYDREGRVLIAERPPGKHVAGRWEFPGGKIDVGETEEAALGRELTEELGITLLRARPLVRLAHDYDDRRVEISLWLVEKFSGRERENIFVVRADAQFDPIDGYPVDNASHPNEYGAAQYAASAYAWIKTCLATGHAQPSNASKP